MFAARRCASARVHSRDPRVHSVSIGGYAGTAAACADLPGELGSRRGRRCRALPGGKRSCGKRGGKLAAGADAELGEDLPQVVDDGGAADEQLRGDLRVRGAFPGEAGDQRLLRGQGVPRLDGAFAGLTATCPQFDARPFGKRYGTDRVEDLIGAAELIAGVTPAPL